MDRGRQERHQGGRPRPHGEMPQPQQQPGGGYGRQQGHAAGHHPAHRSAGQQQRRGGGSAGQGASHAGPPSHRPRPAPGAAPGGGGSGAAAAAGTLAERLTAAAADASQPVGSRVASLQQLNQALYNSTTQVDALQHLSTVWPRLVGLLWDSQHAVCAAAAGPVGALGALAAQAAAAQQAQRGITSGAAGMLFDWLLPVLTSKATPSKAKLTPQQLASILLALRNCLSGVDAVTLTRYANAVFDVCQKLLEDEGTAPQLVPPLLEVVLQASKHQHSLRARFTDLVDLLLGWALEPALPAAARVLLARVFLAFQPIWQQQAGFAASLLGGLLADMERFAGVAGKATAGAAGTAAVGAAGGQEAKEGLGKVLGLAPCVVAILEASWQEGPEHEAREAATILRLARCLAAAVQLASEQHEPVLGVSSTNTAATVAELASHLSRLADLACKLVPSEETAAQPDGQPAPAAQQQQQQQQHRKILQQAPPGTQAEHPASPERSSAAEIGAASGDSAITAETAASGSERAPASSAVQQLVGEQGDSERVRMQLWAQPCPDIGERVRLQCVVMSAADESSVAASVQQAFSAALTFLDRALQIRSLAARPDAVVALVGVLRRWTGVAGVLEARGAQGRLALMMGAAEAQLLRGTEIGLAMLRVYNDAAVLQRTAELYLHLLRQAPSMLDGLLIEMESAAAQLGAQQAEQGATVVPKAGVAAAAGQEVERGSRQSREAAALLHFDLELVSLLLLGPAEQAQQQGGRGKQPMPAGQPQLVGTAEQHAGVEARRQADVLSLWRLLHQLLQPSGPLLAHRALWSRALEVLEGCTAMQLSAGHHPPAQTVAVQGMLQLCSAILHSTLNSASGGWGREGTLVSERLAAAESSASGTASSRESARPAMALQPVPAWAVLAALQQLPTAVDRLLAQCAAEASPGQSSKGGAGASREVQRAVATVVVLAVSTAAAAERGAALAALEELLLPGALCSADAAELRWRSLLDSPSLVVDIAQLLVASSADVLPAVAQQAQRLLMGASSSLAAALASYCGHGTGSRANAQVSAAGVLASRCFAMALQPQHRVFKPAQLTSLFNFLTHAAPTAVIVGGAERTTTQVQDWLLRLLFSLPAMPAQAGKGPRNYEGPTISVEDLTTLPQAALFAFHEAARQCVATRLKTHLGGPTQTFAALDQALQRLATGGGSSMGGSTSGAPKLQPGWLFLEFMHSLEQCIFNAHEGCVSRPAPPSAALAFFTGNRKVCQDWFARMRPLALRAAAAVQHHPLTVRHGLLRLRTLESQCRQLLASVPSPASAGPVVVTFTPSQSQQRQWGLHKAAGATGKAASPTAQGPQADAPTGDVAAAAAASPAAAEVSSPAAGSKLPAAPSIAQPSGAGLALVATTPGSRPSASAEGGSPAAALMAAAQGSMGGSPVSGGAASLLARGLLPAVPRHVQQAQQLWHKAADVVAVTARALCALRDPDGVAELRRYCSLAFGPLLEVLGQAGTGASGAAKSGLQAALTAVPLGPATSAATGTSQQAGSEQQQKLEQSVAAKVATGADGAASSSTTTTGLGSDPWAWLDAVQLQAAGQYEAALQQFAAFQAGKAAGPVRELVSALRAEAFAAVQDWQGLQRWAEGTPAAPRLQVGNCLALAQWATGDTLSAARQLEQQQAADAASAGASGLLQSALAGSSAPEGAALRAMLHAAEQRGAGLAGQLPAEAVNAQLQQAQQLQCMGGSVGNSASLASPLAWLASLAPLQAAGASKPQSVPAAGTFVPVAPYGADLARLSTWHSLVATQLELAAWDSAATGPDVAPLAVLISTGSRPAAGALPGSATASTGSVALLLSSAHTACTAGNHSLAASLLARAASGIMAILPAPASPTDPAWRVSAQLQAVLGRLALAFHQFAPAADAAAAQQGQQQAWRLLLDCRTSLQRIAGQAAAPVGHRALPAGAVVGSTAAAAALLLLHWSAVETGGGGGQGVEGSSPQQQQQQQLLEQAKAVMAETQLHWWAGAGSPFTTSTSHISSSRGSTHGSGSGAVPEREPAVDAWEAELVAGVERAMGGAEGNMGQWELLPLLPYAGLKAALSAVPNCAQLWWSLAEWATQYAERCMEQGTASALSEQATLQARSAAFSSYCKALSLASVDQGEQALPALLQILRMLGTSGTHMEPGTLQAGLAAVPSSCWLSVVPQLMAALARSCSSTAAPSEEEVAEQGSEAAVREAVLSVLRRLGQDAPFQVLLPALIELREPHAGSHQLLRDLQMLVHESGVRHPLLAQQLPGLMDELSRASVLWEEQWHTLLQEATAAASRGLGAFQSELAALPEEQQHQALQDGYLSSMAPSILLIQSAVRDCAALGPESPHEARMLSTLGPVLSTLCDNLAQPPSSLAGLQQRTQAIKQAASRVGQHLQDKRLRLSEVAPALSTLRQTVIPVPGAAEAEIVIEAFLPTLHVLHTKTRPKRLAVLGSDGKQYKYLLKGKEDLRTDERLVQFLRAAGAALKGDANTGRLEVHSFGVTPVARRAGLVQWVDNTETLYELYTSWQTRRADRAALLAAVQQQAQGGKLASAVASAPSKPQKPVEAFFSALVPALKAAGVDPSSPRDQWPLPVLQQVFRSLGAAAPRTMLADELWCGAGGPAHWWQRQQAFASSLAAMSIVGYLLGLGDRHLDNILLHKQHGHVVHLDFNVVFNRGASLKVPEVVPFRLTQSLVVALGPAGAHGRFQRCCERALRLLRSSARPLAALLEDLVSDPVVDWSAEEGEKSQRRAFELATALQLFVLLHSSAEASMRSTAAGAAAALDACTAVLGSYLQLFQRAAAAAAAAAEGRELLQRCEATLSESDGREAAAGAKLAEGQQAMQVMLAQAAPVADVVIRALQECQAWQERHVSLVSLLLTDPPQALAAPAAVWDPAAASASLSLARPGEQGPPPVLQLALGMLPSEAPLSAELLLQATSLDDLGQQLLAQRAGAAGSLADSLQQYCAALAYLLGPQYASASRHAQWAEAFSAALALPVPQGFQRAAELAPRERTTPGLLQTWRSQLATSTATSALLWRLGDTKKELQRERVDLALFANEAKERLLGLLSPGQAVAPVLRAFAAFSQRQADAVAALLPISVAAPGPPIPALDSLQPLVLGYTTTAVAFQQGPQGSALFEELFTAADGSSRLDWLSVVVQAVDGLASLSLELQLLCPALLGLAASQHAQQVNEGLAAAAAAAAGASGSMPQQDAEAVPVPFPVPLTEPAQALEGLAVQLPALANLLQLLQQVHATGVQLGEAAGTIAEAEEDAEGSMEGSTQGGRTAGWLHQQRWLVRKAAELWEAVMGAAAALASSVPEAASSTEDQAVVAGEAAEGATSGDAERGSDSSSAALPGQPNEQGQQERVLAGWESCSKAVAAVVDREVVQLVLPAVAASFQAAAAAFQQAAAAREAQQGQLGGGSGAVSGAAQPELGGPGGVQSGVGEGRARQPPELVPFTDFDDSLAPAGELLGELEPAGASSQLEPFAQFGEGPAGGTGEEQRLGHDGGGLGSPSLVPFTDFGEELGGEEGLLEPLEPLEEYSQAGFGGSTEGAHPGSSSSGGSRPWEGLSQASGRSEQQQQWDSQGLASGCGGEQLAAALSSCADAAGAMAAVDSLLYLTGLAVQQCQQQAQQAGAELATIEWLEEEGLLQAGLLPSQLGSWGAAGGISPEVAGREGGAAAQQPGAWALRCPRGQLLGRMQASLVQLAGAQQQLQQWQAGVGELAQELEEQLSSVMLFAVPALKGHLGSQQQWLATAAAHAASLAQLAQGVLLFEASRSERQPEGDAAAPGPGSSQQYQHSWQQYESVLQQMQGLHQAYLAAEGSIEAANRELAEVQQRRSEALSVMQAAQAKALEAEAQLSPLALPLIKATRKLGQGIKTLDAGLAELGAQSAELRRVQRHVSTLGSVLRRAQQAQQGQQGQQGHLHLGHLRQQQDARRRCQEAVQQLQAAAGCLAQLPAAVRAVRQGVQAAQAGVLQRKGKGEGAVRQTAEELVASLLPAILELQPQIEAVPASLQLLDMLPSLLALLSQLAQQHAEQLAAQHQLAPLVGLPALLGLPDSSVQLHGAGLAANKAAAAAAAAAARHGPWQRGRRSLAEAVGLPALPRGGAAWQEGPSGMDPQAGSWAHAAHVLDGFWAKLRGSHWLGAGATVAGQGASGAQARQAGVTAADGAEGGEVGEAELVEELIREATSEANLARMYEGWSAWL